MNKVVVIGAGGHGREIAELARACAKAGTCGEFVGHVVDPEFAPPGRDVNGWPILGGLDWLEKHRAEVLAICAVGAPALRRAVATRAKSAGAEFVSLVYPGAVVGPTVRLGEGVVIAAGCALTTNIRLGNHVHLNLGCTVGHDSVIGDFTTLSQGVRVPGFVTIKEGCDFGTGAVCIDRITVFEWSIVGAGSVLIKDVPADTTVVGVPARVIKTRPSGWQQY